MPLYGSGLKLRTVPFCDGLSTASPVGYFALKSVTAVWARVVYPGVTRPVIGLATRAMLRRSSRLFLWRAERVEPAKLAKLSRVEN